MYQSTPVGPLMGEAGLILAQILLDYRQRKYAYQLLTLPDKNPTKSVLPITLRLGDGNAQPVNIKFGFKISQKLINKITYIYIIIFVI